MVYTFRASILYNPARSCAWKYNNANKSIHIHKSSRPFDRSWNPKPNTPMSKKTWKVEEAKWNESIRLFVLRLLIRKSFPSPRWTHQPSTLPQNFKYLTNEKERRTHGTNSPNFRPTISSVISTSWYIFPLCTENRKPTKLGNMVALRACVLMGGVPGGGGSWRGRGRLYSFKESG